METNKTILLELFYNESIQDMFEEVYSNPIVNFSMLILHLLGLVACFGLAMVIWFERSGQAGQYRTLVNQLVSYRIEQMIYFFLFGFSFPAIRIFYGPMPILSIPVIHFGIIFPGINILLFSVAVSCVRFSYIFIFKAIPNMNEKLIVTLIVRVILVWNFIACTFKIFFEEKITITAKIISGTRSEENEDISDNIPLAAMVASITFLVNIPLSLAIALARKTFVVPFNQQNSLNLGSYCATILTHLIVFVIGIDYLVMNALDPSDLNQFPKAWIVHTFFSICPSLLVISQFAYFFVSNAHLRKAIRNAIFSELLDHNE